MNIVVQKYGGSSVSNKEKLEVVCEKIIKCKQDQNHIVAIVSAQGKTTDRLLKLAHEYSKNPSKKELDFLLNTGEMQTASLLSLMLNDMGYKSTCLTGAQAGIISDSTFGNAKIKCIYNENILNLLKNNYIVIVSGFQAIDKLGNLTTLGRGGSDLSAVAIASSLKAKRCEIYSDIDGIYTADPRIIHKAKLLQDISYDEMLEAATAGAKVLHNRSVNVAKKYNTEVVVKNTLNDSDGTRLTNLYYKNNLNLKNCSFEDFNVKFITKKDDISKISLIGNMIMSNKEIITEIFNLAYKENINIYMITFSELSINIIIDQNRAYDFMNKLHDILIK